MVGRKLGRVLSSAVLEISSRFDSFGFIARFCPQWMRRSIKRFYRRLVTVPLVLPSVEGDVCPWEQEKPILSVIIPCHNYGRYIREGLRSLEVQTFSDFETILVDDGSDDPFTLKTLDDLQREGFRILRQQKLNAAAAFNRGIAATRGRYVCCFAADDKLEPTYFEKCLCLLESNSGVDFAYPLARTFGDEKRIWLTEPFDLRVLLGYNHICGTAVFKKVVWEKVGGFDVWLDGYEDWDFWIRAGKAGFRGRLIPEILFNYRRHRASLNIKADRKSRDLIRHIRSTSAELFANPKAIVEIQKSYRDVRARKPFLNLSSKTQYRKTEHQIIVIAPSPAEATALMPRASKMSQILVTTGIASRHDEHRKSGLFNHYALSLFLDRYCWLDFLLNLIETRSALLVLISHSPLAYEWVQTIKARAPVPVVDILPNQLPDNAELSARYDQFIDLHVVTSAGVVKSFTQDFGLSEKKNLFSESHLDDEFTKRLQSLLKRGEAM